MPKDTFDLDAALEDEATPAGLRKWAESVQVQNKKLADELAGFKTTQRQNVITGALKTLGVNDKVAVFYPSDADASAEAVAKWLKDNEGVFAALPANQNKDGGGDDETPNQLTDHSPVHADLVSAMRMVQDATPVSGGTPSLADRAAEVDGLKMSTQDDRAKLDSFVAELQQMARQSQQAHFGGMQR